MSTESSNTISYRPMQAADIDRVPIGCQGDRDVLAARIRDLGSAAMLAFDGEQHVGQLQFRRYEPNLRSPDGLWDPLYWGDFGEHAPELPAATIAVFCYHVGQTADTDARDSRYQGRGIGLALLDHLIEWGAAAGFTAMVAKSTPPQRAVMAFMGGQPAASYVERGFELVTSSLDAQLRDVILEKNLVPDDADFDIAARVGCCVKYLK
jgi:GNAT superfamily N-acetyltransferase